MHKIVPVHDTSKIVLSPVLVLAELIQRLSGATISATTWRELDDGIDRVLAENGGTTLLQKSIDALIINDLAAQHAVHARLYWRSPLNRFGCRLDLLQQKGGLVSELDLDIVLHRDDTPCFATEYRSGAGWCSWLHEIHPHGQSVATFSSAARLPAWQPSLYFNEINAILGGTLSPWVSCWPAA